MSQRGIFLKSALRVPNDHVLMSLTGLRIVCIVLFMPAETRYLTGVVQGTFTCEVCRWKKKKHLEGLLWLMAERDQAAVTEASLLVSDTYPQSTKHKPGIVLPEPTYAVLCGTGYFKDKYWEQNIFYSPERRVIPLKAWRGSCWKLSKQVSLHNMTCRS